MIVAGCTIEVFDLGDKRL